MIFVDQETRELFAKTPPVLQVIVSDVEFELAKMSLQAELIDVYNNTCTLAVEDGTELLLQQICSDINKRYRRFDREFTCVMPEAEVLNIKCSSPSELSHVH